MKLIVGLGNPGDKYKNNRHNVGHFIADRLQATPHGKNLIIKKSDVFMNESGSFVKKLLDSYSSTHLVPSALYIVHDDLDIALGSYKIQFGKGPKVHNGISDIEEKLDTKDFWRVRIGVDNRNPENRIPGEEYVLQDFTKEEKIILDKVIEKVCREINLLPQ